MAEQTRGNLSHFVSKTVDGTFDRLAKGISSMSNALNPQEQTNTYIDDSSSTVTTGYNSEWGIDGSVYDTDPALDMLHDMAVNRDKGDDAIIYMVNAFGWMEGKEISDSVRGYRQECNFAPGSDGGGDGGSDVSFSGTIRAKGNPIYGDVVITKDLNTGFETCTFTPDTTQEGI
jgi:hypothetical protein